MGRVIDLTDQIIGRLTVIKEDLLREEQEILQGKRKRRYWLCRCECGNVVSIAQDRLRGKTKTQSCGCLSREKSSQRFISMNQNNAHNLTGMVFNRLTVQYSLSERKHGALVWHCICECGNECDVRSDQLITGCTQSCGCLQKENSVLRGKSRALDISNQIFGYLQAIYPTDERDGKSVIWICRCLKCGNDKVKASVSDLKSGNNQSCGCINSIGEANIQKILQINNIQFKTQQTFDNLINEKGNKYRYDFYLPEYNRLIEFDGIQHYEYSDSGWNTKEHFEQTQYSDKIKNEYALSHSIDLIRIPYWERDNITLETLLGDKYLITEIDDFGEEEIIF